MTWCFAAPRRNEFLREDEGEGSSTNNLFKGLSRKQKAELHQVMVSSATLPTSALIRQIQLCFCSKPSSMPQSQFCVRHPVRNMKHFNGLCHIGLVVSPAPAGVRPRVHFKGAQEICLYISANRLGSPGARGGRPKPPMPALFSLGGIPNHKSLRRIAILLHRYAWPGAVVTAVHCTPPHTMNNTAHTR